jgi:hypothetical protein
MEEWRSIAGYEGLYEVSNLGNVRSIAHTTKDRLGRIRCFPGTMLEQSKQGDYLVVSLCQQGVYRTVTVHVLVLTAFVGSCPEGMEGCHEDGNGRHNAVFNLRWDTHSNNLLDTLRHGTNQKHQLTHCVHNHLLCTPNLVKARWEKLRHRVCLACSRAHGNKQTAKRLGLEFNFQEIANQHYKKIMGLEE